MRGPLAAGTGYRNPESPPPVIPRKRESIPPASPPLGETERGLAPQARRRPQGASCLRGKPSKQSKGAPALN